MLAKSRNYWSHPKYIFEQAFYSLILLIHEKNNISSVPFIILNFPPSSEAKKGSHKWHFDHFINIFWVKRTFKNVRFLKSFNGIFTYGETTVHQVPRSDPGQPPHSSAADILSKVSQQDVENVSFRAWSQGTF